MTTFWPDGFDLGDTQSPVEMLQDANSEWISSSQGKLSLVLQSGVSTNGETLITVHAMDVLNNRTISLFTVVYRANSAYPATIQFPKDDLPVYLRKAYVAPGTGIANHLSLLREFKDPVVIKNEWVCDDPAEFRSKLRAAFNSGATKSSIVNLLSRAVAKNQINTSAPLQGDDSAADGDPDSEATRT